MSKAHLTTLGYDSARIELAIADGGLRKVSRGWFATPQAHQWELEALAAGARVGCLSGCQVHGLWTPQHAEAHFIIGMGSASLGSTWHRSPRRLPGIGLFPLSECLAQVIRHHTPEEALMVLESAVHKAMLSSDDAQSLIRGASVHKQRTLQFFDGEAGSGSETRVRLFLQQHRFAVRSQHQIAGVGAVDLLVGRSLIIECDSAAHHTDHREDRRRDLAARELGYSTLRLSYSQIHKTWSKTSAKLLRILRTGEHLTPTSPLRT
ncbi:endonuclease domain-containing protein [Tessaracoccus sp. Z1128]